ncbi:MAG: DUF1697 domain-containing protein [Chloroflexota bacterium]
MSSSRYIALLRGINVGGHKKIKMADLRACLEVAEFTNVKTVLASGNVAFDRSNVLSQADKQALANQLSGIIEAQFGFPVPVIVVTQAQIQDLIANDPFADITVTDNTRLYVTFLPQPTPTPIDLPHQLDDGKYTILTCDDGMVTSVLELSKVHKTTDAMKVLETHFGKAITTRNWKTVLKIAKL